MRAALLDIRRKLQDNLYRNERQVSFAIVARLLAELQWDVWNPAQVYAEFSPVPDEDATKVDWALFSPTGLPSVFIEVKHVGKTTTNLDQIEAQLRDYNRNITAPFCIITDGVVWRFYYSMSPGAFASKCFRVINLLSDDLDDVEIAFLSFLARVEIESRNAEKEAQSLLTLSHKQKAMEECLSNARRLTQDPPFPTLPDALIALVSQRGHTVSRHEAETFIQSAQSRISATVPTPEGQPTRTLDLPRKVSATSVSQPAALGGSNAGRIDLSPERPDSLTHTSVDSGGFDHEAADNWNALVYVGLRKAIAKGHSIDQLRSWLNVNIEVGAVSDRGFRPVNGTNLSVQYMQSNRAWENALALAKQLNVEVRAEFHWHAKDSAAHPGQSGKLYWSPRSK